MSASREKKQRQDGVDQVLTQKEQKEQKEAAAKKRKATLYAVAGGVIAILVAALLIWNSGVFQGRSTAASVNGRSYIPTDVEYYYRQTFQQEYTMAQYGLSAYNPQLTAKEQIYDEESGQTYHDYFLESALTALTEAAALEDAAQADGYVLSADGKAAVDAQMDDLKANLPSGYTNATYLKAVYGKYMTVSRYKACLERDQLISEYYNAHLSGLSYDEAAIEGYYNEHQNDMDTIDYRACSINGVPAAGVDADGNSVDPTDEEKAEAMSEARAAADELAAAVRSGGSFEALANIYAARDENSNYSGARSELGASGVIDALYQSWLTDPAREIGDVEIFESEGTGYHVVQFDGRSLNQDPTVDIRHILIKAEPPVDDPATTDVNESQGAPAQEALDAAKAEAQAALDEWNAGDKTAESFGVLAERLSDDGGSSTNGGLYEKVAQGDMFPAFNDWIVDSARQPGETTLIENTQAGQQGWHVVYFQGLNEPVWKKNASSSLSSAEMTAWLEGLKSGYVAVREPGIQHVG